MDGELLGGPAADKGLLPEVPLSAHGPGVSRFVPVARAQ